MLQEATKKTVSARRRALFTLVGVALFCFGVLLWTPQVTAPAKALQLERVTTPEARTRGLSGRANLPDNHGMLFVFDNEAIHCFWMKDMSFAIDIIWLNAKKEIVHIEESVKPESFPTSFCPDQPAQYVVEVGSGMSRKLDLTPGSIYDF